MAKFQYGGQALIEGVLMRGRSALAVALRHPDGSILYATERLDLGLRARRALKLPFVRGLVVLYDTLVTGTRWLVRSATLQAEAEIAGQGGQNPPGGAAAALLSLGVVPFVAVCGPALACAAVPASGVSAAYSDPDASSAPPEREPGLGKGFQVAVGGMLVLALAFGIGVFFLLPLLLAQITVGRVTQGLGFQLTEGVIRVAIFILYLMLIARAPDVRRTFQYHGAEHMSIHTLEAGDPLTVEAARKYPTAHPRCGTEFLVVVLIISILLFALVGSGPWWYLIATRVLLIPVIAAVSYEVLQFGARYRRFALIRWLWSPGILVQAITTRQPTDDMVEVAIVSLERALDADGQAIPEGSARIASRPLRPEDVAGARQSGAPETGAPEIGASEVAR
jgi:uncharacterized protein YqhQ